MKRENKTTFSFHHGLGDTIHFAHAIPLFHRRGIHVSLSAPANKRDVFLPTEVNLNEDENAEKLRWKQFPLPWNLDNRTPWVGNKPMLALEECQLPDIGTPDELWHEYCSVALSIEPHIPDEVWNRVDSFLGSLPRPILLLHTAGSSLSGAKNLTDEDALAFYRALIDRTDATIVLLDWHNRVPRLAHYRVRHLEDDWKKTSTLELFALISRADLLVGVDSGPLYAARMTGTPAVGLWTYHHPARFTLPHENTLHIVPACRNKNRNRFVRIPFNLVEYDRVDKFDAEFVSEICGAMLRPPVYLNTTQLARDVQLQHFVSKVKSSRNDQNGYSDRHRSVDVVLRELKRRFRKPRIVETGTIRAEEDWAGTGFSTYLYGYYCWLRGGELTSIDLRQRKCEFARKWTKEFGESVSVIQGTGEEIISSNDGPIDMLYLDSVDLHHPNMAVENLREVEAAMPRLHAESLIVIDDTVWDRGRFDGKGRLTVPHLMSHGWKVLYSGQQTVLARDNTTTPVAPITPVACNERFIIVVGMARTGTTIFTHTLGTHPGISIYREGAEAWLLENDCLPRKNTKKLSQIAEMSDGAQFVVLKRPWMEGEVNWLRQAMPNARFVVMTRNRDAVLASWSGSGKWALAGRPFPKSEPHICYDKYMDHANDLKELMGDACKVVSYEEMVECPQEVFAKIATWLNLPTDFDLTEIQTGGRWKSELSEQTPLGIEKTP